MNIFVKGRKDEQIALIEVKWIDPATQEWVAVLVAVEATPEELGDSVYLGRANPIRRRAILKAQQFATRFSALDCLADAVF